MTWTRPGVRGRITLAATAAVAIVLALAGVALVILLQRDLLAGVDALALARAQDIAALSNGTLPAVLPAAQNDASLAQVLDGNGGVLAASGNVEGESALIRPNPGQREPQVGTLSGLPIGGAERFRVLQETTGPPTAPRTIVVALSLAPVDQAVQSARSLLIQVLPAALLLTALVTWLGVGRALAPVERIPPQGRRDRWRRPVHAGAPAGRARRGDPPGRDHERDAGPAGDLCRAPAPVRRRCLP